MSFYELTITFFLLPTVFQRLANDQFCNSNHCIVITVSMPLSLIIPFSLANDSHSSFKQPLLCFIHVVLCFFVFFPLCRDVDILIFLLEGRVLYNFQLGVGSALPYAVCICLSLLSISRFLGLLVDTLHLPIYCLVDCDPYGFDILSTYRFGSLVRPPDQSINLSSTVK